MDSAGSSGFAAARSSGFSKQLGAKTSNPVATLIKNNQSAEDPHGAGFRETGKDKKETELNLPDNSWMKNMDVEKGKFLDFVNATFLEENSGDPKNEETEGFEQQTFWKELRKLAVCCQVMAGPISSQWGKSSTTEGPKGKSHRVWEEEEDSKEGSSEIQGSLECSEGTPDIEYMHQRI